MSCSCRRLRARPTRPSHPRQTTSQRTSQIWPNYARLSSRISVCGQSDRSARCRARLDRIRLAKQQKHQLLVLCGRPARPAQRRACTTPQSSQSSSSAVLPPPLPRTPPLQAAKNCPHSPPPSVLAAAAWDPAILADRLSLSASKHPILVDTRPYAVYQARRIAGSVNVAIPSLILKRYRKPGSSGGFHSLNSLRQFMTSEDDKQLVGHTLCSRPLGRRHRHHTWRRN
ncbi:hypothetical protein F5J12DRAFT_426712 [Pisolithus orientalis]|uniref:uncharacterized protein n=1 Tax=Pisolithus orientalis TaxID=936130 RepID=UPI002225140B|nr:uncharacterized protein F5J12DRAFT_426712 [Pisolithus orientalis]KAI5993702.1 hypothetical protein F5J12DRAFT_426712 [Pisolithus orientalis]